MYKALTLLVFFSLLGYAEQNTTQKKELSVKTNKERNVSKEKQSLQKHLQEQLEREKKYAKEQKFYMGKEYNLTQHQVDKAAIDAVNVIEPDYDFDITDVYRDDI